MRRAVSPPNYSANDMPSIPPFFRYRRIFAGTFPFVFGATHFYRNAKLAVVAPMTLGAG
jgi:hypothetical protein